MSIHLGVLLSVAENSEWGSLRARFLDALGSKQADTSQGGNISIDDLEAVVSLTVALKTGGLQRPTVDRDNQRKPTSGPELFPRCAVSTPFCSVQQRKTAVRTDCKHSRITTKLIVSWISSSFSRKPIRDRPGNGEHHLFWHRRTDEFRNHF